MVMKKKIIACVCMAAVLLSACGNDTKTIGNDAKVVENTSDVSTKTNDESEVISAPTGFYLTVNGYNIVVDAKMSDVIEGMGPEESYFEAPSCAFDGIEKTYTYSDGQVVVKTYLGNDKADYVNTVVLKNDLISTNEGLSIGDASSKVIEIYGEDYKDNNGSYEYTKDNMKLLIVMEEGVVVSIQYTSNFLEQ